MQEYWLSLHLLQVHVQAGHPELAQGVTCSEYKTKKTKMLKIDKETAESDLLIFRDKW